MGKIRGMVVAGTHSGCGKTSVALGLMAALRARGLTVQPFKVGPDYIDPGHHQAVTGRPSHNLDGWMLSEDYVREVFGRYSAGADMAVIEGAMGLFDGATGDSESGSTAQIAKWLGLPVLLVVDARSMARSAAALVGGYVDFDPGVEFAGVVFNKVASANHAEVLGEAVGGLGRVWFLGREDALVTPSRHLGLVTAEDFRREAGEVARLAAWVAGGVAVGELLEAMREVEVAGGSEEPVEPRVRIGLARDRAFSFYYEENLRLLRQAGAELVEFSPVRDRRLPEGLGGLYLGGGYPELAAGELDENLDMRAAVKRFVLGGGAVYAECGGFMYLMEAIREQNDRGWPMAGVFGVTARMEGRLQALGYREIETLGPSLLGPAGIRVRGHEFRYSRLEGEDREAQEVYRVKDKRSEVRPGVGGLRRNGALGSYVHLHFGSAPEVARSFADACPTSRTATRIHGKLPGKG